MTRLGVALVCVALVACAPDPDPSSPSGEITISGAIAGTVPAGSKAILVFAIDTGSGDGVYKWGEGTSPDGATYAITVGPPPTEALLLDATTGVALGVAAVLIVPSDLVLPDGVVADPAALAAAQLAVSSREAVIWREGTFTGEPLWPNDFPERVLRCGTCVDNVSGFDAYAPASCDAVGVTTNLSDPNSCNWT